MPIPTLSSLLLAAALISAPAVAWSAPSSSSTEVTGASGSTATTVESPQTPPATIAHTGAAPVDEAAAYAQREAAHPDAAKFRGGSTVLVIGGSTTAIVLLVVLLVVLL